MSLDSEIQSYRCPMGMVSNLPNPESRTWDNPALFTAQWMNLRCVLGGPAQAPGAVLEFVFWSLATHTRWPKDGDKFTGGPPPHDELLGWAYIRPDMDPLSDIYYWYPKERRFIDLVPFVKSCMGERLSLWDKLAWALVTIASTWAPYEDTSGKCKKWVQLREMRQSNYRICNWAIRYWQYAMTKKYPKGLQELFGIYFGYEHPLTRYAPKNFELG